ncbi:MAG: CPBP family intramembrane metalloprotease [Mycobacterium sp.]|nr:CPBP family intramembrane metalloprotease [Mycobacterium sp.]
MQPRTIRIELAIVLATTFGLAAATATLQLIDFALRGLGEQRVALNPRRSYYDVIDAGLHLAAIAQLLAWGALAVYLLWRSGITPRRIGLGRFRAAPDLLGGLGLAALIGIPGLGLYVVARRLGLAAQVVPAQTDVRWWVIVLLIAAAIANAWAEEVVVVGYLLTRLEQLKVRPRVALLASAALRGGYHLYQGFGAGLGNLVMGLVFGYTWRRSGRLWPLIVAHAVIDVVAFVGYALLANRAGWLR